MCEGREEVGGGREGWVRGGRRCVRGREELGEGRDVVRREEW